MEWKKKVKGLIITLLQDKKIYNTIIKTADIHLKLINIVINILYKPFIILSKQ